MALPCRSAYPVTHPALWCCRLCVLACACDSRHNHKPKPPAIYILM